MFMLRYTYCNTVTCKYTSRIARLYYPTIVLLPLIAAKYACGSNAHIGFHCLQYCDVHELFYFVQHQTMQMYWGWSLRSEPTSSCWPFQLDPTAVVHCTVPCYRFLSHLLRTKEEGRRQIAFHFDSIGIEIRTNDICRYTVGQSFYVYSPCRLRCWVLECKRRRHRHFWWCGKFVKCYKWIMTP